MTTPGVSKTDSNVTIQRRATWATQFRADKIKTSETKLGRRSSFVDANLQKGAGDQTRSVHSHHSDLDSLTSFNEIVQLNDEGHPYIDINRLVYHPNKHDPYQSPHLKNEKLSWYVPDFSFILLNLISLCVSTYFILSGFTSLTWVSSMGMFTLPDCLKLVHDLTSTSPTNHNPKEENFYFLPCLEFLRDTDGRFNFNNTGYNFSKDHHDFWVISTKLTSVQNFGLVLIVLGIVNVLNVVLGINACLQGYKGVLSQHITVDGTIVLGEFIVSSIVSFSGQCDERELQVVRMLLRHHVRWYDITLKDPEDETDKEKLINLQLDSLQINLGCCGVDSWVDYLPADWPYWYWPQTNNDLNDGEMVIPFSCCTRWWIRNIYCSHGAHLWAHPSAPPHKIHQFRERIYQEGCIFKLHKTCERIRLFMGRWAVYATILHLVFIVLEGLAAQVMVKNINNTILESKKIMRRKEMTHDPGAEGSELDLTGTFQGTGSNTVTGESKAWTKIPPPTEDEIMTIKQRSNYNRFVAHIKDGIVGEWMKEAHTMVAKGHIEPTFTDETEEEKKLREKLLLTEKKPKKEHLKEEDEAGGDQLRRKKHHHNHHHPHHHHHHHKKTPHGEQKSNKSLPDKKPSQEHSKPQVPKQKKTHKKKPKATTVPKPESEEPDSLKPEESDSVMPEEIEEHEPSPSEHSEHSEASAELGSTREEESVTPSKANLGTTGKKKPKVKGKKRPARIAPSGKVPATAVHKPSTSKTTIAPSGKVPATSAPKPSTSKTTVTPPGKVPATSAPKPSTSKTTISPPGKVPATKPSTSKAKITPKAKPAKIVWKKDDTTKDTGEPEQPALPVLPSETDTSFSSSGSESSEEGEHETTPPPPTPKGTKPKKKAPLTKKEKDALKKLVKGKKKRETETETDTETEGDTTEAEADLDEEEKKRRKRTKRRRLRKLYIKRARKKRLLVPTPIDARRPWNNYF